MGMAHLPGFKPCCRRCRVTSRNLRSRGKLLDVRSGKMLSDQMIVIRGERIERIAASSDVKIAAGATVVDLTGKTVLPGLIDCHTHIMLADTDNSH